MAWGAKQSATQQTAVSNSWVTIQDVALNPRELIHVQVTADNESGTVTDALEVRVLSTLDASTENWDDTPIYAQSYEPSAVTAESFSFVLSGYYKIRIQAQSAGATDDYTVDLDYRLDGVSA